MTAREWKVKLWERINAWSACRDNIQKKIPIVVEIDLLIEKAITEAVAEERERTERTIGLFGQNNNCGHLVYSLIAAIRKVKP